MTIEELREQFDLFISEWCPDAAHLLDTDENDGQRLWEAIQAYANSERKNERQKVWKSRLPKIHEMFELPFMAKTNGYISGDMFEDWLNSDKADDPFFALKQFLRRRDEAIKKQAIAQLSNPQEEQR